MPKGIPLSGDRSAWDAADYPEKHANDIDTADGIHHTIGTDAGQVAPGTHTHIETDITDLDHTDANAIHDNVAGEIAAIEEKTTPADADVTVIEDSEAGNAKKRLSWSNIKATLKSYFDGIYAALSHTHTETDITDLDHDAGKVDGIGVDLTGIADGDALVYDEYEDKIVPGEGGGGGASSLNDLTDVDLTGLADGDVLVFDETSGDWLPETPAGGSITVEEQDGTPSVSNVNKIKFGEEAYMHLHLWKADKRQKGIGARFVKMTLPYFFDNLLLKKLYCEPYALNPAPNKTVEKIGFTFIKEHISVPGSLNFEQLTKLWELSYDDFKQLK